MTTMKTTLDTHTGEKFSYNTTALVKFHDTLVRTVARITDLNVIVLHPERLTPAKRESLNKK